MIPNFGAFCLEFIAMAGIEKVLYFHALMIMGESEPFTSIQGFIGCVKHSVGFCTEIMIFSRTI